MVMRLSAPIEITSRLLPGVRIETPAGPAWLSVEPHGYGTGEDAHRYQWVTRIDVPANYDRSGSAWIEHVGSIGTGSHGPDGAGARAALSALCSFLAADAESYGSGGNGPDGDGFLFPDDVVRFAHHMSDEIAMVGSELDDDADD